MSFRKDEWLVSCQVSSGLRMKDQETRVGPGSLSFRFGLFPPSFSEVMERPGSHPAAWGPAATSVPLQYLMTQPSCGSSGLSQVICHLFLHV